MEDIPDLLRTMTAETGEKSAAATKRLYELCDVGHKQNRVPMVCGGQHDMLTPLAACLTQESGDGRHLACLALNNLSIPTENKRAMALGPASAAVIGGLCQVIAEDKQELYLCCICLMNLSFLEASVPALLRHSPVPAGADPLPPLDNDASLLRVLERLLKNAPAVPKSGSGKFGRRCVVAVAAATVMLPNDCCRCSCRAWHCHIVIRQVRGRALGLRPHQEPRQGRGERRAVRPDRGERRAPCRREAWPLLSLRP